MRFQELREPGMGQFKDCWLLWLKRHVSHMGNVVEAADGEVEVQRITFCKED